MADTGIDFGGREHLLALADDEHLIGQQHTEWIGVAPFLEEDLAFASIAQDELGHAAALYEVITHSAGNSWMFENRMAHVLAADYTPLSAVDIFVKDLGLVLDTARASKFPLPLASTAHQMFMQASTAGFAREDDSAVIKIFPGIELPKKKD